MLGNLEERLIGADTHILLTTLEEYHPRKLTILEHNCLQILYLHTEEKLTNWRLY